MPDASDCPVCAGMCCGADEERIAKARAAASYLGPLGAGVLAALDGDPAEHEPDLSAVRDAVGEDQDDEPREVETVDLVAALRNSVEAAKARRARGDS